MLTPDRPPLRTYKSTTVTVTARCDECRFWIMGEQWGDDSNRMPVDQRRGSCHRNAPRPTMGDFEYYVLDALCQIASVDTDDPGLVNNWEDARLQQTIWPTTTGEDFCGEFSKRETPC